MEAGKDWERQPYFQTALAKQRSWRDNNSNALDQSERSPILRVIESHGDQVGFSCLPSTT